MDILERIRLSLENGVVENGIDIVKFSLNLHECFMISLETQEGYLTWDLSPKHEDWNGGDTVALTMANVVEVTHSRIPFAVRTFQWNNIEGFGIKNWILHFQNITHTRTIHEISIDGRFEKFEVNSVARTLLGLDIDLLVMDPTCTDGYCNSIYQKVHTRCLQFNHNPFRNKGEVQKVLIQNLEHVFNYMDNIVPITLNDLLMMNCEMLVFRPTALSMKDLNEFFRNWTKGSNPRLKRLILYFGADLFIDRDQLLDGLRHERDGNRYKIRGAKGSEAIMSIVNQTIVVDFVD